MTLDTLPILGQHEEYPLSPGRRTLEDYIDVRQQAFDDRARAGSIDSSKKEIIFKAVNNWVNSNFDISNVDYTKYDEEISRRKILGLINFVEQNFPEVMLDSEIEASKLFVEMVFAMWDEYLALKLGKKHQDADGHSAFIVPNRASKYRGDDYGTETVVPCPITDCLPHYLRGFIAAELPPFVVDRYNRDDPANAGYMINSSVYPDGFIDRPFEEAKETAQHKVDQSVDFANRMLGVKVVSLGGFIPSFTRFGQTVTNKDVIITTGHPGTVYMMGEHIRYGEEIGLVRAKMGGPIRLGSLGVGSIGRSAAEIISGMRPESQITIFDTNPKALARTTKSLTELGANFRVGENELDVLENSDVVLSAIVGQISLKGAKISLEDTVIYDDSQPSSVSEREVTELGGHVMWIVAKDNGGVVKREGYRCGTLADFSTDRFTCEVDASILSRRRNDLMLNGLSEERADAYIREIAANGPVTTEQAIAMGGLYRSYNIDVATPQYSGTHILL